MNPRGPAFRCFKPLQRGRVVDLRCAGSGNLVFPDGGQRPLQARLSKYQNKPHDGHGSHHQGKHKLG